MTTSLEEKFAAWHDYNPDGLNRPIFSFTIPSGITPITFVDWFINHVNTCESMTNPKVISDIINKIRNYVLCRESWISERDDQRINQWQNEITFALAVIQFLIDNTERYQAYINGLEQSYSEPGTSRIKVWQAFAAERGLVLPDIDQ